MQLLIVKCTAPVKSVVPIVSDKNPLLPSSTVFHADVMDVDKSLLGNTKYCLCLANCEL